MTGGMFSLHFHGKKLHMNLSCRKVESKSKKVFFPVLFSPNVQHVYRGQKHVFSNSFKYGKSEVSGLKLSCLSCQKRPTSEDTSL